MSDPPSQRADGLHFLGLPQLPLGLLALCYINEQGAGSHRLSRGIVLWARMQQCLDLGPVFSHQDSFSLRNARCQRSAVPVALQRVT
jgi:hypothetical protein